LGRIAITDLVLAGNAMAIPEDALHRVGEALTARLAKYKIPRRYRIVDALSD
jgi:hypothetical protein